MKKRVYIYIVAAVLVYTAIHFWTRFAVAQVAPQVLNFIEDHNAVILGANTEKMASIGCSQTQTNGNIFSNEHVLKPLQYERNGSGEIVRITLGVQVLTEEEYDVDENGEPVLIRKSGHTTFSDITTAQDLSAVLTKDKKEIIDSALIPYIEKLAVLAAIRSYNTYCDIERKSSETGNFERREINTVQPINMQSVEEELLQLEQ